MDTMSVLGGILDAGLENVASFAIFAPIAVTEIMAAEIGTHVSVNLGGTIDMPSINRTGEPRLVMGRVKLISDGLYYNRGSLQG